MLSCFDALADFGWLDLLVSVWQITNMKDVASLASVVSCWISIHSMISLVNILGSRQCFNAVGLAAGRV